MADMVEPRAREEAALEPRTDRRRPAEAGRVGQVLPHSLKGPALHTPDLGLPASRA